MKYYLKQVMIRGLIGMLIGLAMGYTVILGMSLSNGTLVIESKVVLFNYLAAIAVGFYMAASTVIFDVEEWSLMRQTSIHSLVNLPYLWVAAKIHWMPEQTAGRIVFILFYFSFYAAIWLGFKLYWSHKLKDLNAELKMFIEHQEA
ncbi:MAG: DUF3021 domain-containing protein [Clostridia bacterium]|nr:DUF3021 domain-containing protein [Clostridia bacterium]